MANENDHPGIIDVEESVLGDPIGKDEEVIEADTEDLPDIVPFGGDVKPGEEVILPKAKVKDMTPLLTPKATTGE